MDFGMTQRLRSAIPDGPMLTLTESSPEAEIFDAVAIAAELEHLAAVHAGSEHELRLAVSRRLRVALARGRAAAERLLIADRHGRRCAERLSFMQDEIVRLVFEFAIDRLAHPHRQAVFAEAAGVHPHLGRAGREHVG